MMVYNLLLLLLLLLQLLLASACCRCSKNALQRRCQPRQPPTSNALLLSVALMPGEVFMSPVLSKCRLGAVHILQCRGQPVCRSVCLYTSAAHCLPASRVILPHQRAAQRLRRVGRRLRSVQRGFAAT